MLCNKESIRLKKILVNKNILRYEFIVSEGLKKYFNRNYILIKYSGDIDYTNVPKSILVIPFVSSILPLMWLTDSIMWIEEIDSTFYHSLFNIKQAYQDMYDYFPLKGALIPAYIKNNNCSTKKESLVLFSGGIDAHTTYLRHKHENPLLFNVQGWYNNDLEESNEVAEEDIVDISNFAIKENKSFIYAKSNFATLININYFHRKIEKKLKDTWWHGFQHSMAFISIAIPLCYYLGIRKIYIASSFSIGDSGRCASYPTTDSEFFFAQSGCTIHDGFELTRQDKVKIIVDYQKLIEKPYYIKVCTFNKKNCCICEKCIRTILGIIAENGDPRNYGFFIEEPVMKFLKEKFVNNLTFFDVAGEEKKHWGYIKQRMIENYSIIKEKEVVDWFLNTDFLSLRRKKVFDYRMKNFVYIILRRIKKRLHNE